MFWTVFLTFKREYAGIMALTTITSLMNLCGPFIINPLISYIRDGTIPDWLLERGITFWDSGDWPEWLTWLTPTKQYGLSLATILVLSQALSYIVQE